jgi:hypothetical protein
LHTYLIDFMGLLCFNCLKKFGFSEIVDKWASAIDKLADSSLHMTHLQRFERLYIRFEAQMQGFHNGCRPIIGLDGCHLKGVYGGQLLSAVGRDGKDNLPMAAVEAETKTWFLMELTEDLWAAAQGLVSGYSLLDFIGTCSFTL